MLLFTQSLSLTRQDSAAQNPIDMKKTGKLPVSVYFWLPTSEALPLFFSFSDVKMDIYNFAEVKKSANVMGVIRGSVEPGETPPSPNGVLFSSCPVVGLYSAFGSVSVCVCVCWCLQTDT